MKILVTGAAGFLGKHLAAAATDLGEVVALTRGPTELPGLRAVEQANLSDAAQVERIFQHHRPDVVLHAAARIPKSAAEDIWAFFDDNVRATTNIFHFACAFGVRRIVFSSSMSVYGKPLFLPVTEGHPLQPDSPYALSKIQSELTAQHFACSGLETTVLRYSGIFGQGQRSGAIPAFIARCLRNEPLRLNAGGRPSSDFVWVRDVVQANLLAIKYSQTRNFEVMNIGSGAELTIGQLAGKIRALSASRSAIEITDESSPRDFRFCYDITGAREKLRFAPTPVETALLECIRERTEAAA